MVRSEASYRGRARHSGSVIIKPGVRISLLTFSRDISLSLPVPIPAIEQDIDLGSVPVSMAVPASADPESPSAPRGPEQPAVGGSTTSGGGGSGTSAGGDDGQESTAPPDPVIHRGATLSNKLGLTRT